MRDSEAYKNLSGRSVLMIEDEEIVAEVIQRGDSLDRLDDRDRKKRRRGPRKGAGEGLRLHTAGHKDVEDERDGLFQAHELA